jgi:hypothetical protein
VRMSPTTDVGKANQFTFRYEVIYANRICALPEPTSCIEELISLRNPQNSIL